MNTKIVLANLIVFILATVLVLSCGGQKAGGNEENKEGSMDAKADYGEEKVILPTEDGPLIYGTLMWPKDGEPHPAVVLCHQFRSDRESYKDFQTELASHKLSSLAIDFRGFGESTDNGLSYANFTDQDYMNMLNDIKAALLFLQSETVADRVIDSDIGLVGASIGANLALMAGAEITGFKCVAALSPGLNYHGLEPLPYIPRVSIPAFIAYSKNVRVLTPYKPLGKLTKYINSFDVNVDKGVFIQIAGSESSMLPY